MTPKRAWSQILRFLVIKEEFSGDKKIATIIASTKPLIIVPLT